uniref:Biotin carboxyl carrier protein of acetyl-CoA carboxylase n=1 Tax=Yamadaella caenomyce TaxID=259029 RepID=A0A1G4NYU4_9FLOR|nr:Acetyl-CoA carboxylase, biotin carboxyl carrier protein [Yamadaella caenomyce]SCW23828.1 Acetyl-CoA carboxylase, biotin carboxyl carrier protein [Yamadaella caenomyce]
MKFNLNNFQELLNCSKNNDLTCVAIKHDSFELIVNRETRQSAQIVTNSITDVSEDTYSKQKAANKINKTIQKTGKVDNIKIKESKESEVYFTIVSPMVGTFYRSPGPNEPYFIDIHDNVKINDTVCIVEAMKLMNEIEAEVDGEIIEILVQDGQIVDCGQPLIKIRPD